MFAISSPDEFLVISIYLNCHICSEISTRLLYARTVAVVRILLSTHAPLADEVKGC